jgi:hypothetical protein
MSLSLRPFSGLEGVEVGEKKCNVCSLMLPLSSFYRDKSKAGGMATTCKGCNLNRLKKNYNKNKSVNIKTRPSVSEKSCNTCLVVKPASEFTRLLREVDGLNRKCRQCLSVAVAKAVASGKVAEYARIAREKRPHLRAAHQSVREALRKGLLEKSSCEVCGVVDVEAHHEDYAKPLDVIWLCVKHHAERHMEIKREEAIKSGI